MAGEEVHGVLFVGGSQHGKVYARRDFPAEIPFAHLQMLKWNIYDIEEDTNIDPAALVSYEYYENTGEVHDGLYVYVAR
jgi:hypothetical protein